jgi:hypothetical protein
MVIRRKPMAHITHEPEQIAANGRSALRTIASSICRGAVRFVTAIGEDGRDGTGRPARAADETDARTDSSYGPEVADHIRSVIEKGYFQESSGEQVFVPWYIRSLLISEMNRHL